MGSNLSFVFHSIRLHVCFCYCDFAVHLEIRYGSSSSVVYRGAWTGQQSGSCFCFIRYSVTWQVMKTECWWRQSVVFLWWLLLGMSLFPWVWPFSRSFECSWIPPLHPSQNYLLIDLCNALFSLNISLFELGLHIRSSGDRLALLSCCLILTIVLVLHL